MPQIWPQNWVFLYLFVLLLLFLFSLVLYFNFNCKLEKTSLTEVSSKNFSWLW